MICSKHYYKLHLILIIRTLDVPAHISLATLGLRSAQTLLAFLRDLMIISLVSDTIGGHSSRITTGSTVGTGQWTLSCKICIFFSIASPYGRVVCTTSSNGHTESP